MVINYTALLVTVLELLLQKQEDVMPFINFGPSTTVSKKPQLVWGFFAVIIHGIVLHVT